MSWRVIASVSTTVLLLAAHTVASAPASPGKVTGTFLVAGADAELKHVRAVRAKLDEKGKKGYAVLLSARPATGDISPWRMGDPKERGSFIYLMLEANGEIWIAELAHAKAKTSRFGVVTEVGKVAFEVRNERLVAHVRTAGEQTFTDDRYSLDLRFEAPLEGP